MCSVARRHTDRHTLTKVNTEDTLSGFQEFFLQSIKDGQKLEKGRKNGRGEEKDGKEEEKIGKGEEKKFEGEEKKLKRGNNCTGEETL